MRIAATFPSSKWLSKKFNGFTKINFILDWKRRGTIRRAGQSLPYSKQFYFCLPLFFSTLFSTARRYKPTGDETRLFAYFQAPLTGRHMQCTTKCICVATISSIFLSLPHFVLYLHLFSCYESCRQSKADPCLSIFSLLIFDIFSLAAAASPANKLTNFGAFFRCNWVNMAAMEIAAKKWERRRA